VADLRDESTVAALLASLGRRADVVLSDVAPKLTGVRDVDDARCAEAVAAVIAIVRAVLRPGGRALLKIFMDAHYRATIADLERSFRVVKSTRPDASRRGSAELYVFADGFVGGCG
jgi:23S rRNA (uridine2552-2'-O)-methyltransferase